MAFVAARATFAVGLFGRERERREAAANKTHHRTLSQPPKNLTASVAALKAEVNATKTALATEVALKLGGGATVDATLPRFTGDVTCYVEDATGDVVGLQFGSSAPLCSTAGTARSFNVPHEGHDGHIADVKVAVDKATGLVGGLTFVVKTNDSALIPTNVVTCGTRGGVGVSVMPKLAALAGVTASCKPAQSGRRLHQAATGLAIDPAALSVAATTVNAPAGASGPTPLGSPPALCVGPSNLPATDLSATGRDALSPQIGVSSDGTKAVAVWTRFDGSRNIIQASTATIANNVATWSASVNLSASGQVVDAPQIGVSSDGTKAVAVWRLFDGSNYVVQASTATIANNVATWSASVDLSAIGQTAGAPQIGVSSDGTKAVAVWRRGDGSNFIIQGAPYLSSCN